MPFELHIALRYLLARRKQAFISVISLISTLGVTVGVMALIIALALMTGLQQELRDRILGSAAHVMVWKIGEGGIEDYRSEVRRMLAQPHVIGAAPAIYGKAIVTTRGGDSFITVKGIDPTLEGTVTDVEKHLVSGSLPALTTTPGATEGIVLGADLSKRLSAYVGDTVTLLTPQGTLSPFGLIPVPRQMQVVGIFRLGLFEFDSEYGFVGLPTAQRLFGKDRAELIELRVDDIYDAPAIAQAISDRLGRQYVTQDWGELNRSLFSALWLEKAAISITIGLIVVVAALNIVASLILLVMEKTRDIAILKTMGASARSVMVVFMLQGIIIGVTGTVLGSAAGYAVATVFDRYRLIRIPMDVYQISHIPFILHTSDLVIVIVAAIAICFTATLYPSRQAARLDPAEALRYQ
ncbi:MAG: ABC transporter permease [Acidimicrobiia bacterium]